MSLSHLLKYLIELGGEGLGEGRGGGVGVSCPRNKLYFIRSNIVL